MHRILCKLSTVYHLFRNKPKVIRQPGKPGLENGNGGDRYGSDKVGKGDLI